MKTTRIAAALAALALAAGLLAACGSDEKDAYAEDVVDVMNPIGDTLGSLGTELSDSSNPEDYPKLIGEAQETIDQGISDLEAIDVPEGLENVNQGLIDAFTDFSNSLGEITDAADSGDLAKVQKATFALPEAASEFEQQLNDIQQEAIDEGVPIEDSDAE